MNPGNWRSYVRLIRPHQWSKNAVVLAAVVFGGQADQPSQLGKALIAMFAFCLVSSAIYVFNDWHDRAEDRLHPTKCRRPIAAGEVVPGVALGYSVALLVAAIGISLPVSNRLGGVILLYAVLMVIYTLWLRETALLDVLAIAIGFVLRAAAGAVAVSVPLSVWLFACTLLLALLLGLGKRRQELRMLHGDTDHHRPSLAGYAHIDLDRVILGVALFTVGAYTFYTLAVPAYGRSLPMILTAPFVAAAIWRYLYLVFRLNMGGSPEALLVRDRPLFLSIVAWALVVAIVLAT